MIAAHPLQWPEGWPRTKSYKTKDANFKRDGKRISVSEGAERVLDQLGMMGIDRQDVVVSTNIRTRLDGLPRSGEPEPQDRGAAVYWETRKRERRVMAVDRYEKVADNLAAIAATLDAMRAIERHGGAQILDRAFTGFTALPASGAKRTWRNVMGFMPGEPVHAETLQIRYRKLANTRHPDKPGGTHDAMVELNAAMAEAEAETARAG
jgi:hypothetical protein